MAHPPHLTGAPREGGRGTRGGVLDDERQGARPRARREARVRPHHPAVRAYVLDRSPHSRIVYAAQPRARRAGRRRCQKLRAQRRWRGCIASPRPVVLFQCEAASTGEPGMAALEQHEHTNSSLPDHGHARRPACRGVGNRKKRERERGRRKRQGQECHFTTVLSPQPATTSPRCPVA